MRTSTRYLLATIGLAACHPARPVPVEEPVAVANLALAGHVLVGEGELWLVLVSESEQGGKDLNGDGDALDDVVHVLDLAPDALAPGRSVPGRVSNTGLAVSPEDVRAPLLACAGSCAAFAVDEAAQGGRDLNGDGDALDTVLHVWERSSASARNLALAVRGLRVGGDLVAGDVDEAAQAGTDLDGDGDALDSVLHVFDSRTGSTVNLQLRDSAALAVQDDFVAFRTAESIGLDLNQDGDDVDGAIFMLYDARAHRIHDTALAWAGGCAVSAGGVWGISVDEAAQGRGDLSGDGDTDDAVFHVYDPRLGLAANLELVVPLFPPPSVDGERFLLLAHEQPSGEDANGDGDLEDWVVHVFETATGFLIDTGLASQGAAVLAGDWVGVSVSEAMQGSSDLDGDGEAGGNVVHVFELDSGLVQDLGVDAFSLYGSAGRVFMAPFESSSAVDWNQDGDHGDRILLDWSASDRRTRNSHGAVGSVLAAAGDHALLLSPELERGADQDGDGDLEDLVLELFDARSAKLVPLGLAAGGAVHLTAELEVVALVSESALGRDLNGDGDEFDDVLHVVSMAR